MTAARASCRSPSRADPTPLTVLIVDDYRPAADSLADLLQMCGYDASVATTPDDALAADPADVVIVEPRLRGADGWALVRRMTDRGGGKRPLFIAVTTGGQADDRRRSSESGIDVHLLKPADPAEVLDLLSRFARALGPRPA
jgi:two-component system OmpR family response regulator